MGGSEGQEASHGAHQSSLGSGWTQPPGCPTHKPFCELSDGRKQQRASRWAHTCTPWLSAMPCSGSMPMVHAWPAAPSLCASSSHVQLLVIRGLSHMQLLFHIITVREGT